MDYKNPFGSINQNNYGDVYSIQLCREIVICCFRFMRVWISISCWTVEYDWLVNCSFNAMPLFCLWIALLLLGWYCVEGGSWTKWWIIGKYCVIALISLISVLLAGFWTPLHVDFFRSYGLQMSLERREGFLKILPSIILCFRLLWCIVLLLHCQN